MDDRTRMLAAISHDLRTPITRMRLRSEFIEDDTHRGRMLADLDQMRSMLESVLSFLRNDRKLEAMTLIDIATTLQLVADQFADMGHKVVYRGPEHAMMTARPDDLHRSVTNLVENAVRYGAEATVRLAMSEDDVTIDVEDDGPGISDARKNSCWNRLCAATTPATWTRPQVLASAFPLRGRSRWRMAANCRCTTACRTGWRFASSCRFTSSRRRPPPELCYVVVFPSGRERFRLGIPLIENRDRLEPVVAGATGPEIGDAVRALLDPVGRCDRLAALGTRISSGQIAKICSGHGSLPLTFLMFCFDAWVS
jgi:hypothetical protein